MAKPEQSPKPVSRKQRSRREKELLYRRWLIIGASVVLGAAVVVLGWGIVQEYVLKPRRPVAVVHGDAIPLDDYQRLVQYRRLVYQSNLNQMQAELVQLDAEDESKSFIRQIYEQQVQTYQNLLMGVGANTLEEMIQDRVIRQEAARRGIVVTPDEVQVDIEEQFDYLRNPPTPAPTLEPVPTIALSTGEEPEGTPMPTPTPAPTVTPVTKESFDQRWDDYLGILSDLSGFTEADYRNQVESRLYSDKVRAAIETEAPATAEQVLASHILVATEEEAQAVLARLDAGEDFAAVAQEMSIDTGSGANGGDLGWFTRERMVTEFSDAAFSLPLNSVSSPIQSQYGYHLILVHAHELDRPLDEADLPSVQSQYFANWLEAQLAAEGIERAWSSDLVPPALSYTQ
jgi:parvulin-like peptidyl-prolyl isomerase